MPLQHLIHCYLARFYQALRINPGDADIWFDLGYVYQQPNALRNSIPR